MRIVTFSPFPLLFFQNNFTVTLCSLRIMKNAWLATAVAISNFVFRVERFPRRKSFQVFCGGWNSENRSLKGRSETRVSKKRIKKRKGIDAGSAAPVESTTSAEKALARFRFLSAVKRRRPNFSAKNLFSFYELSLSFPLLGVLV